MSPGTIKSTVTCELKSRAKIIKKHFPNPKLTLGNVLEAFAEYYCFKDWNTASAKLKNTPFNPSEYPAENSEHMDRIINKVINGHSKKRYMSYKLEKFIIKLSEKFSVQAPINWGDLFLGIELRASDEYILSANRMLKKIHTLGLFNE